MVTKTTWDDIVSGKELNTAKTMRSKTFIVKKDRRSALPELEEEGWEKCKEYKDQKWIGVKKDKPFDEQFEDKVWLLFAKMGFTYLNKSRHFKMSYDFKNPDHTQQIDVFAADDESIIIVECKAAATLKDGNFKKEIEALYGQMEGLSKEARHIKKKRLTDVQNFVNNGGYFPNSLIISIDTNRRGVQFDPSPTKVDGCISKLGILHLPKRYRSAYIIDGQHRLYGYSDSLYAGSNSIPVVAFVDLDRTEQIKLFMDINENQKTVSKRLRVMLNGDMLWESPDYNERRKALRSKISQMLGEEETSPLLGRVKVDDSDGGSPLQSITVEALQLALNKCHFFTTFGKKNIITKDGTFDLGDNQSTCDLFYPFIEDCLRYVKQYTESEWNKGDRDQGMITMNRGIQAVIRVINDIVNHLIARSEIDPKTQKCEEVVSKVTFYLDPLIDYLVNMTGEQRKALRGYVGGGADKRFWRAYQKAVADARDDFRPDGLDEYWQNEAKQYNEDSVNYLRSIEVATKQLIQKHLSRQYGENWIIKGIPKTIYTRAKNEADEKNYDSISNGTGEDMISIWDCVTLAECKVIATSGSHWKDIFEGVLTRPEEKNIIGGKEAKTDWLVQLNAISNKLARPTYSVSTKEFDLIKEVHLWLVSEVETVKV